MDLDAYFRKFKPDIGEKALRDNVADTGRMHEQLHGSRKVDSFDWVPSSGIVHHIVARAQFTCLGCARNYSRADSLQMHFRTVHEGRKDCTCKACGKAFGQMASLRLHDQRYRFVWSTQK